MNEKQIAVKLTDDIIKDLDRYAQKYSKSRHDLIKGILEVGVEEINDLEHVGLFQVGMLMRDLHYSIKEKLGIPEKPKADGEGRPIPVKLSEEFIARLDQLAERADITRHQLMKNFIKVGLQELSILDKTKVLQLSGILHKGFKTICDLGKTAFNATHNKKNGGENNENS